MPSKPLLEMTLRAPPAVPPIVLFESVGDVHAAARVAKELGAGVVAADVVAQHQVACRTAPRR